MEFREFPTIPYQVPGGKASGGNQVLRRLLKGSARGYTLAEQMIALALVAFAVVALLQALSGGILNMRKFTDRARLVNLARSQMESIHNQSYQETAAAYARISIPAGFNLDVEASVPRTYTYPSPDVTPTTNVIQQITVTVYTVEESFQLGGYKTRR